MEIGYLIHPNYSYKIYLWYITLTKETNETNK